VILCCGKVYFDLLEEREKRGIDDVYLLRIEQLYPFPTKALVTGAVALQTGRDRVVPGRAAQHGRVVLRRHLIEWVLNQIGANTGRPRLCGRPRHGDRPRPG
jgi:2-oxoglutarate dehydrogenase E1 component